jgi:2-succinyl-5-enolpyruvyl-6-hydroxy-3-cyclohexene-1-carboxylate synthase
MTHTAHARLFAQALAGAGVRHAIVCPGSRSTPLAVAIAESPGIETRVVVDERSAAFVALGQARVTGVPSVVLSTSGSAGAHFYPAILEAESAQVPLLCLTADRPWELTPARANQTLDQEKLFGTHVRRAFSLGPPDPAALAHIPRLAAHAVSAALGPLPGPVHVNLQFRKPLEPSDETVPAVRAARVFPPRVVASDEAIAELSARVRAAERGALVLGPRYGDPERLAESVARFLVRSGFRLFAEVTSGLFFHRATASLVQGDTAALSESDLVIEIGAPPTTLVSQGRRVLIAPDGVPDPAGSADVVVVGDAADALDRVPNFGRKAAPVSSTRDEHNLARCLGDALPDDSVLLVGNSLVVRDLNRGARPRPCGVRVVHQRGLSGIDGLIAGAVGVRSVTPPSSVVTAVIGDVAGLHDVGSLALVRELDVPLVLVVIDNGGGRIFDQLPIANAIPRALYERLFLTPPSPSFGAIARAFGIDTSEVTSTREFVAALGVAFQSRKPHVVVAHVDKETQS